MKFLICFLILLLFFLGKENTFSNIHISQTDTFYILIPKKPDKGYMSVGTKQTRDTNAITYIFGGFFPPPNDDQAFFLDVKKEGDIKSHLPLNLKMLSPSQVIDSLIKHGRQFIRSNKFYAVFKKDKKYYIHPCKGEYLHINYGNDE